MMKKALLFINGEAPKTIPKLDNYDLIACTDGAFHYLKDLDFPIDILDFISGDFDSHSGKDELLYQGKFIYTPDQNQTDFHKSLEILLDRNIDEVDVYGGSGKEQDHFLGNLSTAFYFKEKMKISFFDDYSSYYFIPKNFEISSVKGKMVSLVPFPNAKNIITHGLKWELNDEDLNFGERIGTRNVAENDVVTINFQSGDLLIFIEN